MGVELLAVDGVLAIGQRIQWRGDITIRLKNRILDIQCKRPFTSETVVELAKEGAKQIIDAGKPGSGLVALDLSKTIRPVGKVVPASSEQEISPRVDRLLTKAIPWEFMETLAYSKIIGLILFGRVPVMLEKAAGSFVPFGASVTLVGASKGKSDNVALLKRLARKLNNHFSV